MKTDRRSFLAGAGALLAGRVFAGGAGGQPKLTMGVVSDIHIENRGMPDELYVYGADTVFRKTLRYFRERKVDVVVIAGDMANRGRFDQLKIVGEDWREVFPGNKGVDGMPVEPFFIYGNHDVAKWNNKDTDDIIMTDPAGAWKRAFGWEWSPVQVKTVKGYTFIGAHWGHEKEAADYLEKHRDELKGTKPFFHVQHHHVGGTVHGGGGDPEVRKALAAFPNAVAFGGHSHWPLADDGSVWQGEFTVLGTSSLAYLWLPPHCVDGHDNNPKAPMPWGSDLGKDAMVIEVHDGFLSVERRQMVDDEEIADARIVPVPVRTGDDSQAFEVQKTRTVAPAFPAGAALAEWREQGTSRNGAVQNQVVLEFPSAKPGKGIARAMRYFVEVFEKGVEKPVHTAYYLAPLFFRNPRHFPEKVTLRIAVSALPYGKTLTYRVSPVDCWGRKGVPIEMTVEVQ